MPFVVTTDPTDLPIVETVDDLEESLAPADSEGSQQGSRASASEFTGDLKAEMPLRANSADSECRRKVKAQKGDPDRCPEIRGWNGRKLSLFRTVRGPHLRRAGGWHQEHC
jgi:hypothetical protein